MSDIQLSRAVGIKRSLALCVAVLIANILPVFATTLTVKSTADAGGTCPGADCTLRQAIVTAGTTGTINFSLPVPSTIALTGGALLIDKTLTITGPGANLLTVQRSAANGTPNFRIFDVTGNISVAISGLTIANGNVFDPGGGISNSATLTINSSAISGNTGNGTGGIFNSGTLTITNSTICGNTSLGGAGGIGNAKNHTLTITNSTICGNMANGGASGGIDNSGTLTITNSTISGNTAASGDVGGIYNGGSMTARNTIIAGNIAKTGIGPDVFGPVSSNGFNFIGNNKDASIVATTGDQIGTPASPKNPTLGPLQDNGGPTMTEALLPGSPAINAGNSSGSNIDQRGFARPVRNPAIPVISGGDGSDIGAYEVQAGQLSGCSTINTVVNNTNDSGAGSLRSVIANACVGSTISFAPNVTGAINLTTAELTISKNLTISGPGANLLSVQRSAANGTPLFNIFAITGSANASISGLTISNGTAFSFGGGIDNNGTLALKHVTVSGNSSQMSGSGIHNLGTLTVTNSTISGNTHAGTGSLENGGTLTITNCTISDNLGGIYQKAGTLTITNTTISGNTADLGGGISISNGTVQVRNTIIAGNTATSGNGPDVFGPLTSKGFNLIGNNKDGFIIAKTGDQIGSPASPKDPMLGPLQDNGGPTQTRAPLSGSPAIDKGDSSGADTDQRGFTRPVDLANVANAGLGDGSDIGAFEVQPSPPTPTPTPTPTPSPIPSATPPTTLANISTRLRVETGDNALIGGFIVTGTQPKKVIVRAIGTSLPLADKLANPTLELHGPNGLIEANDNWVDSPNKQAIIDSTIPPASDLESAIVATLPANGTGYTAIVRGVNAGTGIGVVEAYDLNTAVDSRLANISTRGFVQTGDNVLIAGTIVVGQVPQKVIIRAIGPSLPIAGKLANPTLELRDGNGGLLEANDNWVDSPNKQAIIDSTIPPSNDLESAIVATLPANTSSYTAIVRGVNNTTGIAVVEVYALQ